MVVPAVRIIPGNQDGHVAPLRQGLEQVDGLGQEGLFLERSGIAGMAGLGGAGFDKGHGRKRASIRHQILQIR